VQAGAPWTRRMVRPSGHRASPAGHDL
jgi:hypothetical protein